MIQTNTSLGIVRDEPEPRWTAKTPPTGLPFRKREHGPGDYVCMNPALVEWLERKARG